jgi:tetratricopeptide (TPR) repeat protein
MSSQAGASDPYERALELSKQDKLEEAKTQLDQAVRIDPARPDVHNLLGSVYDRMGRLDDAIRCYLRAIELDPSVAAPFNNLGIAYLRKNDVDHAIQAFRRALQVEPENISSHYNLGIVYLRAREYGPAVSHLEQARRKSPDDVGILFHLGTAYVEQGNPSLCLELFDKSPRAQAAGRLAEVQVLLGTALARVGRVDEALPRFEAAIRMRPEAPEPYYKLGLAYQKKQAWAEARAALEKALERHSTPPSEYYLAIGEVYRRLGLHSEAKNAFKQSLQTENPEPGHMAMGGLLMEARRYGEAATEFEQVLKRNPSSKDAALNLAFALYKGGNHQAALERLRILETGPAPPDTAFYYTVLGNVLAKLGQWDQALEALRKGTELEPRHLDLYFQMGLVMLNAGALQDASDLLKRVSARHPNSATLRVGLAQVCLAGDQLEAAERHLHEAIRMNPEYDEPHFLLGHCYLELNRFDQALDSYSKAIERNPDRADFYFGLGTVLLKQGKRDAALLEFQKAAELEPAAETLHQVASIYMDKESYGQAEAALIKAVELEPNHAPSHYVLYRLYFRRGDAAKAAQEKKLFEDARKNKPAQETHAGAGLKPVDYYLDYLRE